MVNSAGKSNSGDLDEDEAELNAIISSDKSCRQLFSDKKKATSHQRLSLTSGFHSKAKRISNFGAATMDLVAETAEEDRYEASDDQERDQRRQRKFSKDDDS